MIPARYAQLLFAFILSGVMSLLVSGIATWRATGFAPELPPAWIGAWLTSWLIAFPAVLILAPMTRRIVARLSREASAR